MPARLRAIVPKREITSEGIQQRVNVWFQSLANDFRAEMAVYAPKRPESSYRRTFKYRRGWTNSIPRITNNSVSITNDVRYARLVGGPKRSGQLRKFRDWGWRSTTDVIPFLVRRYTPMLQEIVLPYRTGVVLPAGLRTRAKIADG
jgi:hypothetical protein